MAYRPTLTLTAESPDGLARFYAALGFAEVSRAEGKVDLELDGLRLSIVRGAPAARVRLGDHRRGYELTLQLEDLASVQPALLAAGGVVHGDGPASGGSSTLMLDPEGNPVRLLAPAAAGPPTSARSRAGSVSAPAAAAAGPTAPPSAPTGAPAPDEPGPDGEQASVAEPASSAGSKPLVTPDRSTPAATAPAATDDLTLPRSPLPATYYSEDGVPTFDAVAERIQRQSATTDGNAVLDAESDRGKAEADTMEKLKKAGKDRLDQLRRSMGL